MIVFCLSSWLVLLCVEHQSPHLQPEDDEHVHSSAGGSLSPDSVLCILFPLKPDVPLYHCSVLSLISSGCTDHSFHFICEKTGETLLQGFEKEKKRVWRYESPQNTKLIMCLLCSPLFRVTGVGCTICKYFTVKKKVF